MVLNLTRFHQPVQVFIVSSSWNAMKEKIAWSTEYINLLHASVSLFLPYSAQYTSLHFQSMHASAEFIFQSTEFLVSKKPKRFCSFGEQDFISSKIVNLLHFLWDWRETWLFFSIDHFRRQKLRWEVVLAIHLFIINMLSLPTMYVNDFFFHVISGGMCEV